MNLKRLIYPSLLVLGLGLSIEVSRSLAQPAGGSKPTLEVSEPEPAPNPVKDQEKKSEEGGIDPELGQIAEPDAPDIVLEGNEGSKGPSIGGGVDEQNRLALENIVGKDTGPNSNGEIMPKLVGADVPTIPIDLLFPNGGAAAVGKKINRVQELAGTNVLLLGLNRISGKSLTFRLNVGQTLNYENLSVALTACYRSAPGEVSESWGYLEVIDRGAPQIQQIAVLAQRDRTKMKEMSGPRKVRKGWMIASSPNVTAIDHAIYDITLLSCEGGAADNVAKLKVASNTAQKTGNAPANLKPEKENSPEQPVPVKPDPAAVPLPSPAPVEEKQ